MYLLNSVVQVVQIVVLILRSGVQDGLVLVWLYFMDARHTETSMLFHQLLFFFLVFKTYFISF